MSLRLKSRIDPLSLKEKGLNASAAAIATLLLGLTLHYVPAGNFKLLLLASMGASTFLLFVVPHSPMAQPWPLVFGHLLSALIGIAFAHAIDDVVIAGACSVGASVLMMQLLRCLHPPGAATALAAGMSGAQFDGMTWQFIGYAVVGNTLLLLLLAYLINNLLLRRRYPIRHSHHPHHAEFQETHRQDPLRLNEEDIEWALSHMDGIVDASKEDLIDIYELAVEHATLNKKENNASNR
jgi:CBS-domain-containing membrane protein